jgi:hypothetical protein
MKLRATRTTKVLCSAAILCLVTLTMAQSADAGDVNLQKCMRTNNTTAKLVKLDRMDGFYFGLSLKSPTTPPIIIAPGLERMWLVQVNGEELIVQADQTGQSQIISATNDVWVWLCYFQKILTMLISAQTCTTPLCYTNVFVNLLIGLHSCVPAA